MKKILFVFSLLLSIGAQSQNIITLGDADNGYILPENINPYLLATQGGVPNYFIVSCIREGNVYPIQPIGTRIYGIACMLCDNIPDSVEVYAFLFFESEGCVAFDSIRVDTVVPTSYLLLEYDNMDTLIPVYEVFFERGYYIDSSAPIVALGYKLTPEVQSRYAFALYNRRGSHNSISEINNRGFSYSKYGDCNTYPPTCFYGAFPIIDSTLRIRHEQASTCGDVGQLRADYTGVRVHKLHWSDTNEHCLYQVAYGRANLPFSNYNVVETTDTSYVVAGLLYGETYAFRVRAKCCFNDTMSMWRPWSDTVRFSRPYYTLTLLANNDEWGTVGGGGRYERNDTVAIAAYPADSCTFEGWSDGDTSNPRTITLVCDTTITAVFAYHQDSTSVLAGENIDSRFVTLTPNPACDAVQVMSSLGINSVDVYNLQGLLMAEAKADSITVSISTRNWPTGTYIVVVHTPAGSFSKRLVVKK